MKKAFTLIELLIVVAIIAILAAIAVPNFLEAQVRSKVSRCLADMRSLATAIEAYTVDYNKPVTTWITTPGGRAISAQSVFYSDVTGAVSPRFIRLTTPVAFMTSILRDPFVNSKVTIGANGSPTGEYDTYDYISSYDFDSVSDSQQRGASITSGAGWRLASAGPDSVQCYGAGYVGQDPANSAKGCDYDATNGTRSAGDLIRIGGGPGNIYTKLPCYNRVTNKFNGF